MAEIAKKKNDSGFSLLFLILILLLIGMFD